MNNAMLKPINSLIMDNAEAKTTVTLFRIEINNKISFKEHAATLC